MRTPRCREICLYLARFSDRKMTDCIFIGAKRMWSGVNLSWKVSLCNLRHGSDLIYLCIYFIFLIYQAVCQDYIKVQIGRYIMLQLFSFYIQCPINQSQGIWLEAFVSVVNVVVHFNPWLDLVSSNSYSLTIEQRQMKFKPKIKLNRDIYNKCRNS